MMHARSSAPDRTDRASAPAFRVALAAVACVTLLGLAACVPTEFDRSTRPINEFQVEQVRMTRDLAFLPGHVALDPGSEAQLEAFLAQVSPRAGDEVAVVGYGPLGEARARATALALQTRGVDPDRTVTAGGGSEAVTITVLRTLYQATACHQSDDIREAAGGARLPTAGCATADNLARMVAEPSDLFRGREGTQAEAGRAATSVERYRAGQVTPLAVEATSQ